MSVLWVILPSVACPNLIIEPDYGANPILRMINQAHSSVDLAIYGLTDPQMLRSLAQAKLKGRKLRVILQHFPYKAKYENIPAVNWLKAYKIAYNLKEDPQAFFHQKTLIIDNRIVVIFTGNFTISALSKQRNFGVIITNPQLVQEIVSMFNADWLNQPFTPRHPELIWSPDNSRVQILKFIHNAQRTINIYAAECSDRLVLKELFAAAKRGVLIKIITSPRQVSGKNLPSWFHDHAIKARVAHHLIIHAKLIIIDNRIAILGSINLTRKSLDYNRELAVVIDNNQIIQCLQQYFDQDWQKATINL